MVMLQTHPAHANAQQPEIKWEEPSEEATSLQADSTLI